MNYQFSEAWTERAKEITLALGLKHIDMDRVGCIVSKGSKTRRVVARIHSFGKAIQVGMRERPFYTIELISEKFGRMSQEDQTKTLIHELLHIPHSFGGGFRHHRPHVNNRAVDEAYCKCKAMLELNENNSGFK